MEKFVFLPTETEVKKFQNEWFLKDHIGLVLHINRRFPVARESCVSDTRPTTYMTNTRVVKTYKKSASSLHIKMMNPCVNNLSFVAFHIDNKGVVIDKENGRLIYIAEGSFDMIQIDNVNDTIVIKRNLNCQVIRKIKNGSYTIEETDADAYASLHEKEVAQNGDLISVLSIKENIFSWEACFYHKFVMKNLEEIKQWNIDK